VGVCDRSSEVGTAKVDLEGILEEGSDLKEVSLKLQDDRGDKIGLLTLTLRAADVLVGLKKRR
jgi:hypothetical protein